MNRSRAFGGYRGRYIAPEVRLIRPTEILPVESLNRSLASPLSRFVIMFET